MERNSTNGITRDLDGRQYSIIFVVVKNQRVGQRTKNIDICWHNIHKLYERKEVDLKFVRSENNESDIFTKSVPERLQTPIWYSASSVKGS